MWFSRLSPGSDIQTLHLTPSSIQYSIVSFEKRSEKSCLIGGEGEVDHKILILIGGGGGVDHKIWRHKAFEDIN